MIIEQIAIAFTGATAIWLTQQNKESGNIYTLYFLYI